MWMRFLPLQRGFSWANNDSDRSCCSGNKPAKIWSSHLSSKTRGNHYVPWHRHHNVASAFHKYNFSLKGCHVTLLSLSRGNKLRILNSKTIISSGWFQATRKKKYIFSSRGMNLWFAQSCFFHSEVFNGNIWNCGVKHAKTCPLRVSH